MALGDSEESDGDPDEGPPGDGAPEDGPVPFELAYVLREGESDRPSVFVGVLSLVSFLLIILLSLAALAGAGWVAWQVARALF